MSLTEEVVENYLFLLDSKGEEDLYRHVVGIGVMRAVRVRNPEIEILNDSESFFALYRRTGNDSYFKIGKALRRAAHKLYRQFLRINTEKDKNARFLHVVE